LQLKHQYRLTAGFCVLMFLAAFLFYALHALNSDVSYFVQATKRILQGAVPYTDILENNPPMAFWITMPPVWLAGILGFQAENVFVFYTLIIAAAIVTLVWWQTRNLILVCAITPVLCVSLAFGFGQREYFASLFFLPYICAANNQSSKNSVLVGVLLGAALCFKPYFIFIPICVELYGLVESRRFSPLWRQENLIAIGVATAYPILVWLLYPQYYSEIVPLALLTYGAFQASFYAILMSSTFVFFALQILLTLTIVTLTGFRNHPALIWLAAAFGAVIAHFIQHMGWPYHLLPGICFASIALLVAAFRNKNVLLQMGIIGMLAASSYMGLLDFSREQQARLHRFDALLIGHHPKTMMVLTYDLGAVFPDLPNRGITWVGHFQSLWMMVAVGKNLISPEDAERVVQKTAAYIADDLSEQMPEYVIVDHRPFSDRPDAGDDNPLDHLSRNAQFVKAWQHFVKVTQAGSFDLWQRKF
jgi:hypothetical protein